jgi:hypothetical protein
MPVAARSIRDQYANLVRNRPAVEPGVTVGMAPSGEAQVAKPQPCAQIDQAIEGTKARQRQPISSYEQDGLRERLRALNEQRAAQCPGGTPASAGHSP